MSKLLYFNYKGSTDRGLVEAKDWFLKLKSEPITAEMLENFHAWLSKNPTHREKFDLMHAVWDVSDVLKEDPESSDIIKKSLAREQADIKRRLLSRHRIRTGIVRYFAIAASIILIVSGIWLLNKETGKTETYNTATGIQKTVYLADGSTVHLDTSTVITAHITRKFRRIELVKGRALFSVESDLNRPFVVTAGRIVVQATGTEFNVYKNGNGKVSVSVTEGSVTISRDEASPEPDFKKKSVVSVAKPTSPEKPAVGSAKRAPLALATSLVSGQEIVVNEQKKIFQIKPINIKKATSWQTGRLYFQEVPLMEVLDEVNRYLDKKIAIVDKRLEGVTISLNFNMKYRKNFLATLEKVLPIAHRATSTGQIEIFLKEMSTTVPG